MPCAGEFFFLDYGVTKGDNMVKLVAMGDFLGSKESFYAAR
jgi:hypothetical protein